MVSSECWQHPPAPNGAPRAPGSMEWSSRVEHRHAQTPGRACYRRRTLQARANPGAFRRVGEKTRGALSPARPALEILRREEQRATRTDTQTDGRKFGNQQTVTLPARNQIQQNVEITPSVASHTHTLPYPHITHHGIRSSSC